MTRRHNERYDDADLIGKSAGILIRGFFAYLALTPVIFCWGLLLIVLFAITLVSFQEQTSDAMAAIFGVFTELTARFPVLERFAPDSSVVSNAGVIEINNSNLSDVIFGLYGFVDVPFVILGMLLDLMRIPRPPRPLSRKIKILSLATLTVIAGLFVNFLFGSETWMGSAMTWLLMFTIGPGIVWGISAVSLSLNHFISTLEIETGN